MTRWPRTSQVAELQVEHVVDNGREPVELLRGSPLTRYVTVAQCRASGSSLIVSTPVALALAAGPAVMRNRVPGRAITRDRARRRCRNARETSSATAARLRFAAPPIHVYPTATRARGLVAPHHIRRYRDRISMLDQEAVRPSVTSACARPASASAINMPMASGFMRWNPGVGAPNRRPPHGLAQASRIGGGVLLEFRRCPQFRFAPRARDAHQQPHPADRY